MKRNSEAITLKVIPVTLQSEVTMWYDGQSGPQQAHVDLDLMTGELSVGYDPEIGGGVPESVWSRRKLRYGIADQSVDAVNKLLARLAPVAQVILDGYDRDAQEFRKEPDLRIAFSELAAACESAPQTIEWCFAKEYYLQESLESLIERLCLKATTTNDELAQLAKSEVLEAYNLSSDLRCVLLGAEEYLTTLRDSLQDEASEELQQVVDEIAQLRKRRDHLIRMHLACGVSSRTVGQLAGLSHTQVQEIGRREG